MSEDWVWPEGKTFGELTPDERELAAKQAATRLEQELTANANAIGKVLDETLPDGTDVEAAAQEIARDMIAVARGSGDEPVVFVTGNAMMPPLRSYAAAEKIWQADYDRDEPLFDELAERVEHLVEEAKVYLGCPDYDNCLYVVDMDRFELVDDPEASETLSGEWKPLPPKRVAEVGRVKLGERITPSPDTVARYLPSNYEVTEVTDDKIVISGRDNAGWTMDGYVIPRLASGLIFAKEVTP